MISVHPIEAWSQAYDDATNNIRSQMPCNTEEELMNRIRFDAQRIADKNSILGTLSTDSIDRAEMPKYISEVYNK